MESKSFSKQKWRLKIAYDGTDFHGWRATSTHASIHSTLLGTLKTILQEPIHLEGASRTDAGVHAVGQIATFESSSRMTDARLILALNALLPSSIRVIEVAKVDTSFHPTLSACSKEYRYYICNVPFQLPQWRAFSWHIPKHLDYNKMRAAAAILCGTHDFAAFCNQKHNESYADKKRRLTSLEIVPLEDDRLYISLVADAFLYKMARNLTGALVNIGKGTLSMAILKEILEGKDRRCAPLTAPAHGLFLHHITYRKELYGSSQ